MKREFKSLQEYYLAVKRATLTDVEDKRLEKELEGYKIPYKYYDAVMLSVNKYSNYFKLCTTVPTTSKEIKVPGKHKVLDFNLNRISVQQYLKYPEYQELSDDILVNFVGISIAEYLDFMILRGGRGFEILDTKLSLKEYYVAMNTGLIARFIPNTDHFSISFRAAGLNNKKDSALKSDYIAIGGKAKE